VNAPTIDFVVATSPPLSVAEVRNEFLQAFFDFEVAIARWLKWLGEDEARTTFGQRLQKLADHQNLRSKAGPKQTKAIKELPEACSDLLRLRNLIAHSRILPGKKDGVDCILFETVSLALAGESAVIPIDFGQVEHSSQELIRRAKLLEGWLKQAQKS
jgi:hypothetical protein